MNEERRFTKFDFPLFWTALSLWVIGIFLVYSATYTVESGPLMGIYKQQIMGVAMAIVIIAGISSLPARFFSNFAYVFYGVSILLLLAAQVIGVSTKGAERWIMVAGFKLQPSEFAKIGLLLGARPLPFRTHGKLRPNRLILRAVAFDLLPLHPRA